jgi:hypothetical protein
MDFNFAGKTSTDVYNMAVMASQNAALHPYITDRKLSVRCSGVGFNSILALRAYKASYGTFGLLFPRLEFTPGNAANKCAAGFYLPGRYAPVFVGIMGVDNDWYAAYSLYPDASPTLTDLALGSVVATTIVPATPSYGDKVYLELQWTKGRNATTETIKENKIYLNIYINGTLQFVIDEVTVSMLGYAGDSWPPIVAFLTTSANAATVMIGAYEFQCSESRMLQGVL